MHRFEVWAPLANSLSVQVNGKPFPMTGPDERRLVVADVNSADHGTDYGFLIDEDDTPYPDPRSQWQPEWRSRSFARL